MSMRRWGYVFIASGLILLSIYIGQYMFAPDRIVTPLDAQIDWAIEHSK